MKNKEITEINREAWNEALGYHQKARNKSLHIGFENPDFTTLNRECDKLNAEKIKKINLSGKNIAHLCCNNGDELLTLMRRFGAKEGVGFDISDAAIDEAKELAKISKLNAKFERVNLLELDDKYNNYFDFIYISEGSFQWFADIDKFLSVAARLLKKNGMLFVWEIHPFACLFEDGFDPKKPDFNLLISYFNKGPHAGSGDLDYVGGVKYQGKKFYWSMHKMGDIINALIKNGIELVEFEEYNFDVIFNKREDYLDKLPMTYNLIGKKK